MQTWLQLTQAVVAELALGAPPAVVSGAQEQQTLQVGALLNRCGAMISRWRDSGWTQLQTAWNVELISPTILTGDITNGSAVVTGLSSTTGLEAGLFAVQGTSLSVATRLLSVDSATQVTLTQPATATAVGQTITFAKDTYASPPDMQGPINRTMWDRTNQWELIGPMSPQEDQWVRSGIVTTGPRRRFRFVGRGSNNFRIWPPPTGTSAPSALSFEYQSAYWAQDSIGTPKAQFTADTDTCVFDDDTMIMGGKWLFLQAKGMEYAALQADWSAVVTQAASLDGGARTLNMAPRRSSYLLSIANVQDGYFPGR